MSLGRPFMAAGAATVAVTLWEVSDSLTRILMEQYKNILEQKSGHPKSSVEYIISEIRVKF
jgi:CHAT domain-containing protein